MPARPDRGTSEPPDNSLHTPDKIENCLQFSGQLLELETLRHTPAGIPALNFRMAHTSEQEEAGSKRRVECELAAVALGPTARLLMAATPGQMVHVKGFLAARSLKSRTPVLHVKEIEFFQGNSNGIQTKI